VGSGERDATGELWEDDMSPAAATGCDGLTGQLSTRLAAGSSSSAGGEEASVSDGHAARLGRGVSE